jgi:hypothetical protein
MANPNIVATSVIYGRTDVLAVGTTAVAITENPAASGKVYKINNLSVANIHGTSSVDVNVDLYRNSAAYHIAKTISVPADSSLGVVGKENPIYLLEGDSLRVTAGNVDRAEAICSYEEIG